MSDGSKRVVEAASEQEAMALSSQTPAETPAPAESASLGDYLRRGMSRAPGNLMQLVAKGMNAAESIPMVSPRGRVFHPLEGMFGVDTQAMIDAPWDAAADETYRNVFGGEPPVGPAEGIGPRAAEMVGGALATPAPVPGSGSAGGIVREGLGLMAGSLAGAAGEEMGLPWWINAPLSIGASMAPSGVARMAGQRASTAKVRDAAKEMAEEFPARSAAAPDFMPPKARPGSITKASSEFKAMIPRGFEDEAAGRLDEVLEAFPDPATRPTTSQALNELGGETMESATASLSRGDRTYSRNLAGQRLAAVRAVDDEFEALRPAGDFPTAQSGYDDVAEAAVQRERAAWSAVPLDQMPRVPSVSIKRAAQEIRESVGQAGARNLPDVFEIIDNYDQAVPFSELQSLRSELLTMERAGRRSSDPRIIRQGAHAARLRQPVEALIDDVAENSQVTGQPLTPGTDATIRRQEGVTALRDAQRITRENRELFDQRSPLVRAFEAPKEAKDIASGLLRGGPQDARRALAMFRQNAPAQDSVRRLVMDELIGQDVLTEGAAKSALKRLREKRQTAVSLFGPEHVQNVERLLRKAHTVRSGRAGTRAAALGTGSNTLASDAFGLAESAIESVGQRGAVMAAASMAKKQTIGRIKATLDRDFQRVMAAATIDPELARDLLRIPGPAALPKWAERMDGHMRRNGIRLVPQIGSGVEE